MRPEMTEACKGKPNDYTDEESAFPVGNEAGLTKREWFAVMALQGMLASRTSWHDYSKSAYELADAMIAEGKK